MQTQGLSAPSSALERRSFRRFGGCGGLVFALVFCLSSVACDRSSKDSDGEQGAAPPPIASSKPGVCSSGGGKVADSETQAFFPRKVGDYCVDPNGETRAYGANASGTLDAVCTERFDGECEIYKSYGLTRVVLVRYVDGKGSPGTVSVTLSKFGDRQGAYGFFTKRVIADADPVIAAPAKLEAGAAGAQGTGIAYVVRGEYVAELSYNNELESPDQLKQSSEKVLPKLARELGERLPGDKAELPAVANLPSQDRVPMGISFSNQDVLNIAGTGPGAVGYYKQADKRWRMASIVKQDDDAAKDVMKTLRKLDGARGVKNQVFDTITFTTQTSEDAPKVAWVMGRNGARIIGVGDEEFVPDEKAQLNQAEKLEKLKAALLKAPAEPAKSGEAKSGEAKSGEAKSGEAKSEAAKPAGTKPATKGETSATP